MRALKKWSFIVFVLCTCFLSAQQNGTGSLLQIDSLIAAEQYEIAEEVLNGRIANHIADHALDSLPKYSYYIGKIAFENHGKTVALNEVSKFLVKIRKLGIKPRSLYKVLGKITDFYDEIGDLNRSLKTTDESLELILGIPDATPEEIGKMEYNIGVCHLSLGDVKKSKTFFKKALATYTSSEETSKLNLSDAYNALGATMWMSSKLDSAKTYYDKAVQSVLAHEGDPIRNTFQAASIRANISLVEHSRGHLSEALKMQKQVLEDYNKVLQSTTDIELLENTKRNELIAIYNLSSFYTEIGNLKKARDILEYSYRKAKGVLAKDDPDLPQYLIALGQSELSLLNYSKAIDFSKQGIVDLEVLEIDDPYWKGKAAFVMAKAYIAMDSISKGVHYLDKGEELFSKALGNSYDVDFLSLYREKALFLAHQNKREAAINSAKKAFDYLQNTGDEGNLALAKSYKNISEVYFTLGAYEEALKWAEEGLTFLKNRKLQNTQSLSNIQIDFGRVPLLLLQLKSKYRLPESKDVAFLQGQLEIIEEATQILENRKISASNIKDLDFLIEEYNEVNDHAKKINLELYQISGDPSYFNKTISLQESGLYHRIRTKLNMTENLRFADVSEEILEREKQLKNTIASSLDDSNAPIEDFFSATKAWHVFLDSLKNDNPKYYKMRYTTIEESVDDIKSKIPEETTLVRYFFIETMLYVYVIDKTQERLVPLVFDEKKNSITLLSDFKSDLTVINNTSNELYEQLWKPIADFISTEKVIIFPDRSLFNLNFELLTPQELTSFKDFTTESLLAKHSISYNYSLLLLDNYGKPLEYAKNFVAYGPEFNNEMKTDYQLAITDSIEIDKTYLNLLPQPFSYDLINKFSRKFHGSSFLNENASKQLFTKTAKEHKIIHIGTHAESNNVSPELSRLVFAKNVSDSVNIDDNYLYTYEIYNQDLSSNLAILTACETGKPTYQPGEGMISLAHAFNYAGSESILTSLWQIDEQSSTQMLEYFYLYLEDGLTKDEALRKAKLDYLATADGRTLHPQYWAGLILMGDTSPISLSSSNFSWWIAILGLLLLVFAIAAFQMKRKK